ncbi:MAG TPA: extracellular solute-binding protein [Chloroflexota bacterium]
MASWRHLGVFFAMFAALALLSGCSLPGTSSSSKTVVTVAYGSTYVFDTTPLANKWWNGIKTQFDKKYSNAEVKLVPIGGSYTDIVNKLSLLYRSSSTAPDVAQLPTAQIGEWASSGYLLPLNNLVTKSSWWSTFPKVVQSEGIFGGQIYAVDTGENDSMMYYNMTMFRKAGLPVPWHPKTWQDLLTASQKIKAKLPGVIPMWLNAGTSSGTNGILQGGGNLINGASNPTIYDSATKKWVVDSPGLREVLTFYHSIFSQGLGAPISDLFNPAAVTVPLSLFQKGQLAIAVGSNYYGGNWTKTICAPCWPQATQIMGAVPIPTINGQAPGSASTLGGWDLAIYKKTKDQTAAWNLLDLMENKDNQINAANWAGFVPPNLAYTKDPLFVNFAPPYNAVSAQVLPNSTITPSSADYSVWGQGFNEATGALAQKPSTTVDSAIGILKSYVTNQLGASKVETLH